MKFVKEHLVYPRGQVVENGWWRLEERFGETHCVNKLGGYHEYHPHPDDEIMEADSWEDLMNKTNDLGVMTDPESLYGWLSPKGIWYGCDPYLHAEVAITVIGKTDIELEEAGWIKVYRPFPYIQPTCFALHVTADQEKFIRDRNIYNEYWHGMMSY